MISWPSSAAYRIALANFAAYAVGLVLLGAIVFATTHLVFSRQLDGMVTDESQELQRSFANGGEQELAKEIAAREASKSARKMGYAVFAPDGRRLYGSLQAPRPPTGHHSIIFHELEIGRAHV